MKVRQMNVKSILLNWRHKLLNEERYRSRLSALVVSLISACPVVLVVVFSYVRTSQELAASELSRRQAIVGLAAATLQEKLHRLTDLSLSLATRVRFRQLVEAGDWQDAIKVLQTVPRDFSFIDRLTIADTTGVLVADTPELPGVRGMSFAHQDWYRGVMAAGKPYVSEVYQRIGSPQYHVIEVAVPITNAGGQTVGILTLQVRSKTFLDWMKGIDTGSRGFLFLVDRHGKTVAHPELPADTKFIDYSNLAPVKKALQGKRGVAVDVRTESGEEQVLAYEPVADHGWGVVLEQSRSGAFELVDRSLRRLLIAYLAVGLGAIAIAYLLLRAFIFAKDMTAALSDSREQFRAVAETANDGVVTSDTQGKIVYFNPAAARLFSYSAEEMIGQPITAIMPARFHELHRRGFERFLAGGQSKVMGTTVELAGRRKDGTEFPLELSLANWRTNKGLFFTGVLRDITARKGMEEQLRAKNELLEGQNREVQQANRLKSEFLANMSHELRTPLNAIIGFAQLMHDGKVGAVSAQHQEYLGDILGSGRHLLQLINDVLDLSKVEAGKMEFSPESVNLNKLISEVCQVLQALSASKRLTIEVEASAVEQLVIDPAKLKQVLYNYLSNAIKFTPEDGRIAVRALVEGEDRFRLEVEDTGIGIAAEEIGKLFVEFQQLESGTTKKHQGTGLGLALTKKIVEAQGGSVGVQSIPGRGSVFSAVLPRISQLKEESRVQYRLPEWPIENEPRVLVIEDDESDRQWLAKILGEAGYMVHSAATGAEGIAKAQASVYKAILLDLILPDMGGWEVLHSIRAGGASQQAPVIVATIVAEREAAKGFPVQDFLVKPVAAEKLLQSLNHAGVGPNGEKKKILVVDDDPHTLKMAQAALQAGGYDAECHASAQTGLQAAAAAKFNAVVLDLVMPGIDGFEFLARFREMSPCKKTPVVVWTSKDITVEDRERLRNSAQSIAPKSGFGLDTVLQELKRHLRPNVHEFPR
jgi:PAS domain S-box-containing protein